MKSYQRGSAAVIGLVSIAALVIGGAIIVATSYIGANNYGVEAEKGIEAKYKDNQNILAQYGQKIQEAAQVPGMQADDFKKVYTAALEGRYGAEGSKATFQWLREQNPQLDGRVYVKLQQIIEAGRNEFQNGQTVLLDRCRGYETNQGYFWKGLWLRIAGFPKNADIAAKMCKPIITGRVEQVYEKGKEDAPIQLR